jgi:hypothetical protein
MQTSFMPQHLAPGALASIFLEFHLPGAATWFYLSLLLAVALFFKFSRLLSVRNLDVVTLFLLVPGLLLRFEWLRHPDAPIDLTPGVGTVAGPLVTVGSEWHTTPGLGLAWWGYLWLLCGSAYFLGRCFFDLALVRRPALAPNLNFGGLAWLAVALFACLTSVAVTRPSGAPEMLGKVSVVIDHAEKSAQDVVKTQTDQVDVGFWVGCTLALLCHLAVVAGLIVVGVRHYQDAPAGMAAATFYLLLPYTAYHIAQWHHVLPMALVVWAVVLYRWPLASGLLLGLAAGAVYFPLLLFPVWLGFYWRRGAGRFAAAFALTAGLCLAVVGVILWQNAELYRSLESVLSLSDWQPWVEPDPRTSHSFWTGVPWAWAYRMPVFLAYLALLGGTAFWPHPKNLAHLLALSTALLIGIQFWYADEGGVYVLWYLPLLLLLVFRPNLADRRSPVIVPETDWLRRLGRFLRRRFRLRLRRGKDSTPQQVALSEQDRTR